jgi:hypothetical protein
MLAPARRGAAWLVVVPLMLGGTEVAHALSYRLVYPQAVVRWQVLAATGHGYMGWWPLVLGGCGAIGLAGFASGVIDAARRRPARPVPAWVFGLLPLAGFTLQELLERWLAAGGLPWWMVEQQTFRVGLLLQLPFALVAFLAARVLLRVARGIGRRLVVDRPRLVQRSACAPWFAAPAVLPRSSVLADGHASRGPPVPAPRPLLCR